MIVVASQLTSFTLVRTWSAAGEVVSRDPMTVANGLVPKFNNGSGHLPNCNTETLI